MSAARLAMRSWKPTRTRRRSSIPVRVRCESSRSCSSVGEAGTSGRAAGGRGGPKNGGATAGGIAASRCGYDADASGLFGLKSGISRGYAFAVVGGIGDVVGKVGRCCSVTLAKNANAGVESGGGVLVANAGDSESSARLRTVAVATASGARTGFTTGAGAPFGLGVGFLARPARRSAASSAACLGEDANSDSAETVGVGGGTAVEGAEDDEATGVVGVGVGWATTGVAVGVVVGVGAGVAPFSGVSVAAACAMRSRMWARRSSRFGIREPWAAVSGWPVRVLLDAGYPPYATPLQLVGTPGVPGLGP